MEPQCLGDEPHYGDGTNQVDRYKTQQYEVTPKQRFIRTSTNRTAPIPQHEARQCNDVSVFFGRIAEQDHPSHQDAEPGPGKPQCPIYAVKPETAAPVQQANRSAKLGNLGAAIRPTVAHRTTTHRSDRIDGLPGHSTTLRNKVSSRTAATSTPGVKNNTPPVKTT